MDVNETQILQEGLLQKYFESDYRGHIEIFEKSLVGRAVRLQDHHKIQLCKMLDQWKMYERLCESAGSLNTLGELPKVALDVITATMSNSILPVIATTQTITSQKSIIWFKNILASTTKGNMTSGETMIDPRTGVKTPSGYASGEVVAEIGVAATVALTLTYAFVVNGNESIRRQFVRVYLASDPTVEARDFDGKGVLYGNGISGTINYQTGAISVSLADDPGNGDSILVDYTQNLEGMADIAQIDHFLDSTDVNAKPYALKAVMGLFQMFELRQRIGDSALQDVAVDLTRGINNEIGGDFIRQYQSVAAGATQFSLTAPVNVSERDHRLSYAFRMADAEADLISRAGRGTVKVMIVGREHAAVVRGLDGFEVLSDSNSLGAHVFGIYKGVTYVRVPEQGLMDAKRGVGLYTGSSPLESAGVYAPYMPLIIQDQPAVGVNPLNQQKVAASMAATKVVVPAYAVNFNVVA